MARQYGVVPLPPFPVVDGAALTSAALGDATPAPAPLLNTLGPIELGQRFEFQAFGRITTAATPGTGIIGIYLGTGAIASGQAAIVSAAIALKASMTNVSWRIEGNAKVTAIGTSGAILGALEISNLSSVGTDIAPATAPTAFTFDTTAANQVRLGWTPSLATASLTCHYFGVRVVN